MRTSLVPSFVALVLAGAAPAATAAQAPAGLAGRACPRTAAGLPSYLYGFSVDGALLCAPATAGLEVCDGVDNNLNGRTDEYLGYCSEGRPEPNTDGRTCLENFRDGNRSAADGCEEAGRSEEAAGRVQAYTTAAQRLDGGAVTEQVVQFIPGRSLSIRFTISSTDPRQSVRDLLFSDGSPACPHAEISNSPDGVDMRIERPRTPTAGGDCYILRAYAGSRTPLVFATIAFILRVRPAP